MKHVVEIKLPKFFNKRKKSTVEESDDRTTELKTEIVIDVEGLKKRAKEAAVPASVCVGCLTIGYLAGFKSGATRVLNKL